MSVKISIITVTYNCAKTIEKTILSVLSLNYSNLEFIIVDGASKDGTVNVINQYKNRISKVISERDRGLYDAMNKGLNIATGAWVYFLNAGDIFISDNVLQQFHFDDYTLDYSLCGIVGKIKVDYNGDIREHCTINPFYQNSALYKNMGFSHQGVFVRTEYAKKVGFDMSYKLCADYNMMAKLYQLRYSFQMTGFYIALIEGGIGASESNRKLQMREEARICGCESSLTFKRIYYRRVFTQWVRRIIKKQK